MQLAVLPDSDDGVCHRTVGPAEPRGRQGQREADDDSHLVSRRPGEEPDELGHQQRREDTGREQADRRGGTVAPERPEQAAASTMNASMPTTPVRNSVMM